MVLLCVNDVALQLPRVTLFQVGKKITEESHCAHDSMFSETLQVLQEREQILRGFSALAR